MKSPTPVVDSAVNWLCADQNVALLSLDEHQAVIGANSFIQSLLAIPKASFAK
ncbi:hypothetical protein AU14_10995 [Marinobacter similis]|uniref:Uncharacterized protein n=1 Tax=Marinobacter similis TaxID=1420916 RepID=W5YUD4_9GAMM|nr:hypothetical protein AU14_10995 [Marinobacter similis]